MEPYHFELHSTNLDLSPRSMVYEQGTEYALASMSGCWKLIVLSTGPGCPIDDFHGERSEAGRGNLLICPLDSHNAASLRSRLAWLRPRPLGLQTSAGMGDRLGLATPGHVRALRAVGANIAPIFAQQSIREMTRTGRSPRQVMDDATWGVFAEGWRDGMGADADHLKTTDDIDACLPVGFTLYTIDPGAYVDSRADGASLGELRGMVSVLPEEIHPRASGLQGRVFSIEALSVVFDEHTLLKAAVKYGRAVAHVAAMYRHLERNPGGHPCELEVSVDETERPTSHAEHVYIASELRRLGVKWVSLAPRFVGRFEKGVDYIGDVGAFQADIAGHAAVARHFGPYKLSLHSGSDKFSVYPAAVHETRGLIHLKTAGTSYLEALRAIATLEPDLLCEIYTFARERYQTDRATYHVSADLAKAPEPASVRDWADLLDQFDAREILHVSFGSVLTASTADGLPRFRDRLVSLLSLNPEVYAAGLEKHFVRHLTPFARTEPR